MPEVVYINEMLDSFTYPGLREVEIVERARKRRKWELALPPINAPEEIPSRVAAVEAFEWEEWISREKDINECQQARLKIVADLIAKREKKHQDATNQKLDNCRRRVLAERKREKDHLM
jgi:Cilia- and flagella-associated protein 91